MKKRLLCSLIILGVINFACKNELPAENESNRLVAKIISGGEDRVDNSINGLISTGSNNKKQTKTGGTKKPAPNNIIPPLVVPLYHVSTIRSPKNEDTAQQANGIVYDNVSKFAYIAYATKDSSNGGDATITSFNGYIDVLNMTNPENPTILQTIHLEDIDLYRLAVDNGKLYVVGAANQYVWNNKHADNPIASNAVLLVFNTSDLNVVGTDIPYKLIDVPGYVAKDVVVKDNKVGVISGDIGVAAVYDAANNFALLDAVTAIDGRAVGLNTGNNLFYLMGKSLLKKDGPWIGVNMDDEINPGAQRLFDFYEGIYPMVSLGANGVSVFNEDLSASYGNIPVIKNTHNIASGNEQANAVRPLSNSLIAIAEGENGVMIHYAKDLTAGDFPCKGGFILDNTSNNDIFVMKNTGGSVPNAAYMYIAAGVDGTRIIRYEGEKSGYTPSYQLTYNTTTGNITIPEGTNYAGIISSNYNVEIPNGDEVDLSSSDFSKITCDSLIANENATLKYSNNNLEINKIAIKKKAYFEWRGTSSVIAGDVEIEPGAKLYAPRAGEITGSLEMDGGEMSFYGSDVVTTIDNSLIIDGYDKFVTDGAATTAQLKISEAGLMVKNTAIDKQSRIGNNYLMFFYQGKATFDKGLSLGDGVKIKISTARNSSLTINGDLNVEGKLQINCSKDQPFRIRCSNYAELRNNTNITTAKGESSSRPAISKQDVFQPLP
ncbi:MAG: hypothetical protein ACK5MI_03965 [Mangrovibacterium sp.]